MFTKQQLAAWREQEFEFDGFYDSVAVEEKKVENKTLTVKYISSSSDDKNIYLTFEITTPILKNTKAVIFVQEVNATNETAINNSVTL